MMLQTAEDFFSSSFNVKNAIGVNFQIGFLSVGVSYTLWPSEMRSQKGLKSS